MLRLITVLLFAASPAFAQFDAAVFKAPPAQYRGHAMWSFPLTTLNENYVISGIQEMARLNYGGFFIEAGGGTTTGLSDAYVKLFRRGQTDDRGVAFLSDEYFRYYKLAMEEEARHAGRLVRRLCVSHGDRRGPNVLAVSAAHGEEPGNDRAQCHRTHEGRARGSRRDLHRRRHDESRHVRARGYQRSPYEESHRLPDS